MPPAMPFPRRPAPPLARVRQQLAADHINAVRQHAREQLLNSAAREKLKPGAHIGITVGSRGMGGFVEIIAGLVDAIQTAGGKPFIIPAMGSHGGAVAGGQLEILRRLGVTEDSVGAPIRATMETVILGSAENGAVAHLDRYAAEADGIIVLGRTQQHPEAHGDLASGLLKMCVVGLGKQAGAQEAHNHGLFDSIRVVPKLHLASGKIICGVAVVENGFRQPLLVEIVPPSYSDFLEADKRLLRVAKEHLPKLPFAELDVLIVDEIGKTISGTGMDLHIVGSWRANFKLPHTPDFKRIVVLSLTDGSHGNGLGIGLADFTTRRFAAAFDTVQTYVNALTATEPDNYPHEAQMPLALDSDREAIEVALYSALAGEQPRVCRIKNTGMLDEFWVSEALLPELAGKPQYEVLGPPEPLPFRDDGNLF